MQGFPMKKILVVDDDPAIAQALEALLKQAEYKPHLAANGLEAMVYLQEYVPDLLILDVLMPHMNGHELVQKVRQLPSYIPVLMLTACEGTHNKVLGLELGADVYMTKPFTNEELLAQVRALLRLTGREQTTHLPLQNRDVQVWIAEKRVLVRHTEITLTPNEFELLVLFIQNPGRVLGRETILRHVWGYGSDDSRAVDMAITRLRQKIELEPSQPAYIQTVRGFGYRWVELT